MTTKEDLRLNSLLFDFPTTPVTFRFSRVDREDIPVMNIKQPAFPVELLEKWPDLRADEKVYVSFTQDAEGLVPIDINFSNPDNFQFVKRYYNQRIKAYFQKMNLIVETDFIGDNQVWLFCEAPSTRRVKNCYYYDRYTLKINYNHICRKPELVISYDRPAKVYQKSVAAFISEYNAQNDNPFVEMTTDPISLLNRVLTYKIIDGDPEKKRYRIVKYENLLKDQASGIDVDLSRVFPVVNNELAQFLGFEGEEEEDNPFIKKNRYDTYIPRIAAFRDQYILTDNFRWIVPVVSSFTAVTPGKVNPDSKNLLFGKAGKENYVKGYIPRFGVNNGPYERPAIKSSIRLMLIANEKQKAEAQNLGNMFKNGYGLYSGLKNYLGWDWSYEKGILFKDDDPLPEIKAAIEAKTLDTNISYIAVFLSPVSKHTKDYDQRMIYFRVKEYLLSQDIGLQYIETDKMLLHLNEDTRKGKTNFAYTLQNISIAINAKLGGTPWCIDVPTKEELVIGVGAVKVDDVQYIGSAFSFANTGAFNSFDYFHKDELLELAGAIEDAIIRFKEEVEPPKRLVIHYFKDMREDEVKVIEKMLYGLKLGDIPIYIVTINKTEAEDLIVFDNAFKARMPYSGRYVDLGNGTFLLCNNTRYDGSSAKIESYPFPVKLKIRCPNAPETLTEETVQGLIDQVYQFSRIYFKSVSQQNLPVTTKYPEMVAEIAPFFTGGSLPETKGRNTLWFL